MQIIKIGGAVLKNFEGFSRAVSILKNLRTRPAIVIISAFSKATRELRNAARVSAGNRFAEAKPIAEKVKSIYKGFAYELINNEDLRSELFNIYDASFDEIFRLLKGINVTQELSPRTLDKVMSYGELLALHTFNLYLRENGFKTGIVDATEMFVTDSNFGNASPIIRETSVKVRKAINEAMNDNDIILTQGFVARDLNGEITTMGMESSNLTAAILAGIFNSERLEIFTDVPGIMSADPVIVPDSSLIKRIDYRTAYRAALAGLRIVHPATAEYCAENNIEMVYRSAWDPESGGTCVGKSSKNEKRSIIANYTGLQLLSAEYSDRGEWNAAVRDIDVLSARGPLPFVRFNPGRILIAADSFLVGKVKFNCFWKKSVEDIALITVFGLTKNDSSKIFAILDLSDSLEIKYYDYDISKKEAVLLVHQNVLPKISKHIHSVLYQ